MDDLLDEFLVETGEQLQELDIGLVRLEQDPNDTEMLNAIFRVAHTIKGTCGFFDLPRLAKLAHAAEALLSRYRDGAPVSASSVTVILASVQRIKEILAVLGRDGVEPDGSDDDLVQSLGALAGDEPLANELLADENAAPQTELPEAALQAAPPDAGQVHATPSRGPAPSPVHGHFDALDRAWQEVPPAPADARLPPSVEMRTLDDAYPSPVSAISTNGMPQAPALGMQTVRVAVDTLETLMTTVSELVLARNQLLDLAARSGVPVFAAPLQRLSAVTFELQDAIMKARLQPIANAWRKLPVLVRTLSTELGKPIEIHMSGGDTELDRQVLEAIKDPLTHLVRNAADHGLEAPRDRVAAGKPEVGRISLRAWQQGSSIVVELSDDGRGIDVEAVQHKARAGVQAGAPDLDGPTDDGLDVIFAPGFSTAESVSEISGRGVGLDVVRRHVEQVGGSVGLQSTSPQGTTFVIKIPLTLAIMPALIVDAAGMRFAIPQAHIAELVRVGEGCGHPVETVNEAAVLDLRDGLVPLLDVAAQFELRQKDWRGVNEAGGTAVIVQAGAKRLGLLVDAATRTEEIVVKPVSKLLRPIGLFSGSTILGDGSVIMILDPSALSDAFGMTEAPDSAPGVAESDGPGETATSLVLFRAGGRAAKAVPLSLVTRIEEIAPQSIERCDGREVVQYRGGLLPLVRLDEIDASAREGALLALVFRDGARAAGLIVDEIIDIVDAPLSIAFQSDGAGIAGSAVVGGQAVEIVDVAHYLGPLFQHQRPAPDSNAVSQPHVLLVDDGQFFRDMLAPLLRGYGYAVTAVASAQEALALKDAGHSVDVVVSDIDMPDMNGFELARAIRSDPAWVAVPLIGLSSQPRPGLAEAGRAAGFDAFVGKFDRQSLMQVLERWRESRKDAA